MNDDFEFKLVGTEDKPFKGYVSARDKTNIAPEILIRGSVNVYKKNSGTIASRFGLKRRGASDSTVAGIKASTEWNTSLGATRPLRVVAATSAGSDAKLQVESDAVTSGTYVWYDLLTSQTLTRYIFDPWWDNTNKKDRMLMVRGDTSLLMWSGGVTKVASGAGTTLTKSNTSTTWAQDGFDATTFTTLGDATTQFDITNPAGTTFRYTYDTTGTDPAISATTVPIGTYILVGAQNFTAANNGIFVVTGVGASYFEVTNAGGVAEANKTIGNGFIYAKYTKVLLISGTTFAYTGGESTSVLSGVTPSSAAVVANSVAVQAVIVYPLTPASTFTNDFIKVVNNMLYVGSYTSRLNYISSNSDFTNYVVTTPRLTGGPELLTLDAPGKGIGLKEGKAHIFCGTSYVHIVSFNQITVGTTLTEQTIAPRKDLANLASAYSHEMIDTIGDDLVYLSQDQQLRVFGTFRNLTQSKFPSLSVDVQDELAQEDFTGGALRGIGDIIYITAPNSGRDYMHETKESVDFNGNVVATERLWHPPQIRSVSRFAVINGDIFGHSTANPQIYQIWDTNQWHDDSPSDEPIPYNCVQKMSYRSNGRRQGIEAFDKVFWEGYLSNGTNLNANIYFDYQGSSGLQNVVINSIATPAIFFSSGNPPSLGSNPLGDNPLGVGLNPEQNDQELLPKARAIADVNITNSFEYDIELYSTDPDCRWETLCLGANPRLSAQQQAGFLRK